MSTAAAKAEEAKKVERKVEPMGVASMHESEYRRTVWVGIAAKGVEPADLLEPSYWAHLGMKLKPYDKIEVRAEDGTWYQELIVLDCSRVWARLKPLMEVVRFTTGDVSLSQSAPTGYEVIHRGPHKWSVVRTKDRAVMHQGEALREAAEKWLDENLEKLKTGALT